MVTYQRGYYLSSDGQGQISKDAQGVWSLYGIAGYKYDTQVSSDGAPLSSYSPWKTITVT
jgi:hypothetical protein